MLRSILAAIRRNLHNPCKRSSRVADETTAAEIHTNNNNNNNRRINSDGIWVSGGLPQTSEMTHIMVRDSLRYAILM